ncbi:archease [Thermocrinis jamiesonii]|uniref:archease n=1 Tax=Thermocrinis jamiesonii TaxID=1302351 RepID=UPI000496AF43|nr:archease [Thermocrinis jamiesonii]
MSFYELIEDITADTGIRVRAKSLEELFCKAILATFNEITDIESVQPSKKVELEVFGELPYLLADTINKALVLHEKEKFVASGCDLVELKENGVRVILSGGDYDPSFHPSKLVIKAATYHRLRVEKVGEEFLAEVIFDI